MDAQFPRSAPGLVRQCAWCWLVMDGSGQYCIPAARKIASATHGICPYCKVVIRAEIDARSDSCSESYPFAVA